MSPAEREARDAMDDLRDELRGEMRLLRDAVTPAIEFYTTLVGFGRGITAIGGLLKWAVGVGAALGTIFVVIQALSGHP